MAWPSHRQTPTKQARADRPTRRFGRAGPDESRPVAPPETTPAQFAARLAMMFGLALIIPGFHLRSLAVLSAGVGLIVGYGAACAHEGLDARRFTAWDEAIVFLSIAWLAWRVF
jgi:hypothetical protein